MAQTRKNRILPLILVLVCAAVMLRSAFTGLEIDEEYALSLGYRLVSGDRLFYDMWEPHQLSSLPAAALLAMFIGITGGTTGVLVFFRLVVLACKAAHELRLLPGVPPRLGQARRAAGGAGAVRLRAQVVPRPGLHRPAVPLDAGGVPLPAPLCHPRLQAAVAGAAGRGVRLLRVFGLPPKRGGLCRAVDRHADFGASAMASRNTAAPGYCWAAAPSAVWCFWCMRSPAWSSASRCCSAA